MKVQLWAIGKTNERYLEEGINRYTKRLHHYLKFEWRVLPDVKKAGKYDPAQLKAKEAETVIKQLEQGDFLVLLDERGQQLDSEAFARFLEHKLQLSHRRLIFLIGGAYGFDGSLYQKADYRLSLSKMTFSHQMARLFIAEQLYRASTILHNEPYHNP
jgi:23S rRNA (pseudouridine1915-N3)-methyltransferase